MSQLCLLANPLSGGGKGAKVLQELSDHLLDKGIAFQAYSIEEGQSIEALLEIISRSCVFDKLIVIAGDGTIHHVIDYFKKKGAKQAIGFIPAGTGNDFARSLYGRVAPVDLLERILGAKEPQAIPILLSDTFSCVNSCGFGLDALVCENVEKSRLKGIFNKLHIGGLIYFCQILKSLFQFHRFSCLLQGRSYYQVALCLVMNNPYFGGGIQLHPSLKLREDRASAIVVHSVNAKTIWGLLWAFLSGRLLDHPCVSHEEGSSFTVSLPKDTPMQVDGEVGNRHESALTFRLEHFDFYI